MRAVVLRAYGPPEVLAVEDIPAPVAAVPGQVLVRVEAVSVVFLDTQIRAGRSPNPAANRPLPTVPGNGIAGEVIGATDRGLIGRRVVSVTGGSGGYAELAAVDIAELITVPDGLSLTDAAALLADGRTAVGLTRATAPALGEWVLVEAAAGGLGCLLVQLAARAGARVIGAASGPRKLRLATELGATATVDYTQPSWTDQVWEITGGAGVDLVFDGVGGETGLAAWGLVRPGGRFCVHGAASGAMTRPLEQDGIQVIGLDALRREPAGIQELTREALDLAASGHLRPVIGQTFTLEDAAAAHAAIESRTTTGKTLLIPNA